MRSFRTANTRARSRPGPPERNEGVEDGQRRQAARPGSGPGVAGWTLAMSPGSLAEEPLARVSIQEYAAVQAALAEDFPLPEVLSIEGIPETEWTEGNCSWAE